MAGSLSYPNKVKDVYTKLVFYNSSDGRLYRDDGTTDEKIGAGGHEGIDNDLDYLKFTSDETLSTGNIFQLINNSSTEFRVTHDGVVVLKDQTGIPEVRDGGLYFDDGELYLGVVSGS